MSEYSDCVASLPSFLAFHSHHHPQLQSSSGYCSSSIESHSSDSNGTGDRSSSSAADEEDEEEANHHEVVPVMAFIDRHTHSVVQQARTAHTTAQAGLRNAKPTCSVSRQRLSTALCVVFLLDLDCMRDVFLPHPPQGSASEKRSEEQCNVALDRCRVLEARLEELQRQNESLRTRVLASKSEAEEDLLEDLKSVQEEVSDVEVVR